MCGFKRIVPSSSNVLSLGREWGMEKGQGRRRHSVFVGQCARAMGLGWSTEVFYSGVIPRDSFPSMYTVPICSGTAALIDM